MAEKEVVGSEALVPTTGSLADLVRLGSDSEAKLGMQLRTIKLGLAASACSIVQRLHQDSEATSALMAQLDSQYREQLAIELPTMNREACAEEYERLMDRQMKVAALEVKMAQGRDMFPEDALSDNDKRLLHLIHAVEASGRMEELLSVVEEKFGESQSFDDGGVTEVAPEFDNPYADVEPKPKKSASRKVKSGGDAAELAQVVEVPDGAVGASASDAGVVPAPPAVEGFAGAAFDDEFVGM